MAATTGETQGSGLLGKTVGEASGTQRPLAACAEYLLALLPTHYLGAVNA